MVTKLFTVCGATFGSTNAIVKSPRDVCTVALYFFAGSMVCSGGVVRSGIWGPLHSGRLPRSDGDEGAEAERDDRHDAECGGHARGRGDTPRDERSDEESKRHGARIDPEHGALGLGRRLQADHAR